MIGLAMAFALGVVSNPSEAVRDTQGHLIRPLQPKKGGIAALFFVTHDCPISNHYAQEIRRICDTYASRGLGCTLVYVDPSLTNAAASAHAREYAHGGYPIVVDRDHALVRETGVTVTPEVALIREDRSIAYRGRIDDFFVGWGKSKREARERDLRNALNSLFTGQPVARPETQAVGCYIADLKRAVNPDRSFSSR
jgi:hypothetical protein